MGTWGIGPFDNDIAADFTLALEEAKPEEREALVRGVLIRVVDVKDCFRLEPIEPEWISTLVAAQEAVAVSALIAAQCPGGEPVSHGPETPMPTFSADLRTLADEALARIVEAGPEYDWVMPEDWRQWQAMLNRLRAVLVPPPPTIALFDIEP